MGDKVVPVFISIDTKRDTPEVVKEYVKGIGMEVISQYSGPAWRCLSLKLALLGTVVDIHMYIGSVVGFVLPASKPFPLHFSFCPVRLRSLVVSVHFYAPQLSGVVWANLFPTVLSYIFLIFPDTIHHAAQNFTRGWWG